MHTRLLAFFQYIIILLAAILKVCLVCQVQELLVKVRLPVYNINTRPLQGIRNLLQSSGDRWMRMDHPIMQHDADPLDLGRRRHASPRLFDHRRLSQERSIPQCYGHEQVRVIEGARHRTNDADDVLHAVVQSAEASVRGPPNTRLEPVNATKRTRDTNRASDICANTHRTASHGD